MTLSSWVLVTGGASAPHPSASTLASDLLVALDGIPELCVGVKTGLEAIEGLVAAATGGGASLLEYFAPEASATFRMMLSGVRSRSERAVIWTW